MNETVALSLEFAAMAVRARQAENTVLAQQERIKELEAQVAELTKPKEPPDG